MSEPRQKPGRVVLEGNAMIRTYDQHQLDAELFRCTRCGRSWFSTAPQAVCLACRRAEAQMAARALAELKPLKPEGTR